MNDKERKEIFLATIKSVGRSSPAGRFWADFHDHLSKVGASGTHDKPPVPLILAASAESNRSKHDRLDQQLQWAIEHGCLEQAIAYLERLVRDDQWNSGSQNTWDHDSY